MFSEPGNTPYRQIAPSKKASSAGWIAKRKASNTDDANKPYPFSFMRVYNLSLIHILLRGDVGDVHIHAHGLIQEIQQERAAQPLPQGRQPRLAEDRVPHVALAGEIHQRFGDIHAFKLHHFRAEPRRQLQVVLKRCV